jgi:hypothetical protein
VYASGIYAARGANPTSNTSDGVFVDSLSSEMVTITGESVERLCGQLYRRHKRVSAIVVSGARLCG